MKSEKEKSKAYASLENDVIKCERCPRLRTYCKAIARDKRKAYIDDVYWGKPVPNFGPHDARLLIVGLAPAAHGANRTGRMFTGDRSGQWVYRALHKAGFANQSSFERADDGLILNDCVITAVAHCAPPDNKPLPDEIAHCAEYLERTLEILDPTVVIAFGSIAWRALFNEFKRQEMWKRKMPDFGHEAQVQIPNGPLAIASYHPSQQNTFTGKLTEPMFDAVFKRAKTALTKSDRRK